ncbi:MAG: hypothetical protein MUO57_09265 [Anaerolineales bacterium]|nr:hypothetical protein [Anaerolineales bacterium]
MIINEYLMRLRHEEFLAEAERNRLLATAVHHPARVISTYTRFLTWLGGLMSRWGSRLEKRFGAEAAVNHSPIDRSLEV